MKKSLRLRAFAKANLSLNITGKDAGTGLHTLDSVMITLDAFDTVTVTERADKKIAVAFRNADVGADNTAYRAASAVQALIGCCGFDIVIEKGIPIGAGLGGSSADGAAVLRALDVMYGLTKLGVNMRKLALSIGSDVPFMLTGGLARVRGVGDELFFIDNKLDIFAVGLMSGNVSTAAAYKKFDELYADKSFCPTDNDRLCDLLLAGDSHALDIVGNALYDPAAMLVPSIADCAKTLDAFGATVNLTGSGGMMLGYFTDIQKFSDCVSVLKNKEGFYVFTSAKTGILHEWIVR